MKEKFDTPYTDSDHTGNGGIRKAASKKYCERRGDQSIYEHGGYWTILWQRFDLPDFVIDAACAGNAEAVERVLQHYDGYINKLCTRTLYDGSGQPHICIDEYMKRRLQIKLIHSIVSPIGD